MSAAAPDPQGALALPVVLVGLPGSGKSKVGRTLARRLGVPHVDTDDLVEAEAGVPIGQIFADEGEASFREREARAVRLALGERAVISLGGGAITTRAVREMLRGHSVVWLDAPHGELLRRVSGRTHRPLLRPDPDAALRRLRQEREAWYREVATARVRSDARPAARVIGQVLSLMEAPARPEATRVVEVGGSRPYPVVIGRGVGAGPVVEGVGPQATRLLLVHPASVGAAADAIAGAARARGLEVHTLVHPDAEAGKTLEVARAGWEAAGAARLGRADAVIGLGGGATTDVAGFIAATWLRGVDVIQVPTTLLAMVDAAVGGKTGINTAAGKNLVGSFHTPVRVVEDLDLLSTLPAADLRAGLGEVIKCGLIADPRILSLVEDDPQAAQDPASPRLAELVERSVAVKARIVGEDLAESGLREVLNYGHTLAHAIEKCEGFTWRHGDAVAVGCVFAAELARELGLLGADEVGLHRRAFASVGLPTAYPRGARLKDLTEAMLSDKKVRGGHLRFVLLDGLQHPVVRAVAPELLRAPAERTGIDVR
jgi:3-dehydroquinate synthase